MSPYAGGPEQVAADAASMTPRGDGPSYDGLVTPPGSKTEPASVENRSSFASSSSNILSPRGVTKGAVRADDVELTTPKTPESERADEREGESGDLQREETDSTFSLPALSQQNEQQSAYHQYVHRQLQLPALSPHARSAGKARSARGYNAHLTRSQTSVSKLPRESARELAKTALSMRATSIGEFTFENPHEANLRESIRRVQAYSRREAPLDCDLAAAIRMKLRKYELRLDEERLSWVRGKKVRGALDTDDVVGAERVLGKPAFFRVHYFRKGRGTGAKALLRTPMFMDFHVVEKEPEAVVERWVAAIQELVRWQARAPPIAEKRLIKVVVNPHSGKRRARQIWLEQVKPFLELGNFEYVVEETTYGGHGADMGRSYSADDGFEALVFIGGDGTLCEFMNGLLTRPEHEWREIVATTPISLVSAGTQNAFGTGAGIPTVNAALYCILKRKMRPLDVITATAAGEPDRVHFSYCGNGWGIAGDIAAESEKYRWMGTFRYAFLKVKRSVLLPKKHSGHVRYVVTEPQPPLVPYDEYRDAGALDQFEVEEGNVYDFDRLSMHRKSWGGVAGGIVSPASRTRYPDMVWKEEESSYVVVGVVNITPDGAFSHPSDGNLDLIITRKGNILRTLQLAVLYCMGKELKSPLVSYIKVKAVEIEPDLSDDCMNMDGEVLKGGPWRMEVVPSLFKVLSEK